MMEINLPPDPGSIEGQVLALSVKAHGISECGDPGQVGEQRRLSLRQCMIDKCKNLLWLQEGYRTRKTAEHKHRVREVADFLKNFPHFPIAHGGEKFQMYL